MMAHLDWRDYLRWLAAVMALGLLASVGFIVLVDPYGLYRVFDRPAINGVKPPLSRHVDEIKLTHAAKLKPDTLILGNSRAEIGFDPDSKALVGRGRSAYNLAIRGTSIATSLGQVEYLQSVGIKPKTVMLGIEFTDFMSAPSPAARVKNPASLAGPPFAVERWHWRFDSLFSMASIKDSITTLFIQSNPEAPSVTSRGFNPLREYRAMARNEGYFALFQQRAQENAKIYLKKSSGQLNLSGLDQLRVILDRVAQPGGEIILIVYPYHAQILALFEETGLWNAFEEWKQWVEKEVSEARERHPGTRIALADFSGYGPYQCEPIPAKGDLKSTTRWYWEAGHFKQELGDLVMEKALSLLDESHHDADYGPAFGVWLDGTSLEPNQRRIAKERAECLGANPQMFAGVKNMVSAARHP